MKRWGSELFFAAALLTFVQARAIESQGTSAEGAGKEVASPESLPQSQWLALSGETGGVKYATRTLNPLILSPQIEPTVEIEQEEMQVDPQTTRITRRIFKPTINGGRQLMELVVEEVRKMPGDRIERVRTTSREDVNGRFRPVQKDLQKMSRSDADTYRILRTLLFPNQNNVLEEKVRVQQIEQRKGESVDIDWTRYVPDSNGNWGTAERRISQNTLNEDNIQTNERVYQYDVNNRLQWTQEIQASEWKDSGGQRHRQSELFLPDMGGKLQLDSRLTINQNLRDDGSQETVQILERNKPGAPGKGLQLVQKMIENISALEGGKTEKRMEVQETDPNGKLYTVGTQKNVEIE